jgi:hypothetical protein
MEMRIFVFSLSFVISLTFDVSNIILVVACAVGPESFFFGIYLSFQWQKSLKNQTSPPTF